MVVHWCPYSRAKAWQSNCYYTGERLRDSSLISTSVRMVHPQRTSDEKRPGRGRQRINPREFATTGPITPETAANYLLHRGLRQDGGGDQRGVSMFFWGMVTMTMSRLGAASLTVTAVAPVSAARPASDSGPRGLATATSCPSVVRR